MSSLSSWVVLLVPVLKDFGQNFLTVLKLQKNPSSGCDARLSATTMVILPLKIWVITSKAISIPVFSSYLCPRLMAEVMTHTHTYQLILMEITMPIVYLLSVIDILLGYFPVQSKMLRFFVVFLFCFLMDLILRNYHGKKLIARNMENCWKVRFLTERALSVLIYCTSLQVFIIINSS